MTLSKISSIILQVPSWQRHLNSSTIRSATTNKYGIILEEPQKTPFGFLKVILTVTSGLFIGAAISKNIANFLEENDLFVPSDDDDDDD
ncbi:hypothetical protein ABEB36_014909 [Hypothenemus hampei]|uniref:Essential MCU regulator, mitochondrial n=1 Tax=Hypothenemus hampei TaxID=57062 RepID=A0ABD1E197_HYPHA